MTEPMQHESCPRSVHGYAQQRRTMKYRVDVDREADGRWIAEVPDLPGVMSYGDTQDAALRAVAALAFRVLAERLEHGEMSEAPISVSFELAVA